MTHIDVAHQHPLCSDVETFSAIALHGRSRPSWHIATRRWGHEGGRNLEGGTGMMHEAWRCGDTSYNMYITQHTIEYIYIYHIIPDRIISYLFHIVSYHIVSYRIISYRIMSYHIISNQMYTHGCIHVKRIYIYTYIHIHMYIYINAIVLYRLHFTCDKSIMEDNGRI